MQQRHCELARAARAPAERPAVGGAHLGVEQAVRPALDDEAQHAALVEEAADCGHRVPAFGQPQERTDDVQNRRQRQNQTDPLEGLEVVEEALILAADVLPAALTAHHPQQCRPGPPADHARVAEDPRGDERQEHHHQHGRQTGHVR